MRTQLFAAALVSTFALVGHVDAAPTPAEARAIAKDAYIYGFPLVDSYRIQHAYFVNTAGPEYKGAWNQIHSEARVYTPADKAVQTPNSDTPYSMLGLDLRAEPFVLTIAPVDPKRYFSVQFIDAYTFNFDYIGTRATGNDGGAFLIAGPNWNGLTPDGVTKVIRSETNLALAAFRTQLFGPDDIGNVKKVQQGYTITPLSAFLGQPAPAPAPAIDFVTPLTPATQKTSPEFFEVLNFVLGLSPTDPSEKDLMARFAALGIGPDGSFDADTLTPELRQAITAGMADAWSELAAFKANDLDTGKVTSGELFGTREYLKNNTLRRMAGAVFGIYGNSREEAMYPFLGADQDGKPLTGASRYTVRFAPNQLPPVHAFWSLTMYQLPQSLLVDNPIKRYLINSPMLANLQRDADGGLTLHIQHDNPGADNEANWLPAPQGPFVMVLRLYLPSEEALDGRWTAPTPQRLD